MKYQNEYLVLVNHQHLLRAALNLAYDRQQQLENSIQRLGFDSMPTDRDNFTLVQVETARELGGIRTRMLLDASQEIGKYHFAPLQIAYCLLIAVISKYKRLISRHPILKSGEIDSYIAINGDFIQMLRDCRDSILHESGDNAGSQRKFVDKYPDGLALLLEGEELYRQYLQNLLIALQGENGHDR